VQPFLRAGEDGQMRKAWRRAGAHGLMGALVLCTLAACGDDAPRAEELGMADAGGAAHVPPPIQLGGPGADAGLSGEPDAGKNAGDAESNRTGHEDWTPPVRDAGFVAEGDAGNTDAATARADDASVSDNPLVGTYYQKLPNGCSYTYVFTEDGAHTIESSTKEFLEADYTLKAPSVAGKRWFLEFDVTSDNGRIDCDGQIHDETGAHYEGYVEFVDAEHVNIYRRANDKQPFIMMTRVEP
jgi:hypothetical protein